MGNFIEIKEIADNRKYDRRKKNRKKKLSQNLMCVWIAFH